MRAYIPAYDLRVPGSLSEALALLAREPGVWQPFAGGTDLMVLLEAGKLSHKRFLSVSKLDDLRGIEVTAADVTLGALTTYTEIQKHPVLQAEFPLLCAAARETGSIATQNRGTLGGNIVNASPAADSPPALLVYDAEIELVSARGARWLPYHGFHTGYKKMQLAPDELLRAIRLPRRAEAWRQYYRKVGTRKAQAISKVCFAGAALVESGTIRDIRIALGSVAPIVLRAVKTEDALRGANITPEVIAAAQEIARARNRAHRRHSLDRALSPARRAKSARRISLAAREMKTIHAIRSKRVVTPEGVRAATVHLRNGVIEAISGYDDFPSGQTYLRRRRIRRHARPGGHARPHQRAGAHRLGRFRDGDARGGRGRSDHADRHAAQQHSRNDYGRGAGNETQAAARKKCWVNVGFWGGVVPGNAGELRALHRAGVFGFKCFLVPSGVPEFDHVDEDDLRAALPKLAALDVPLLVHAELPGPIEEAATEAREGRSDKIQNMAAVAACRVRKRRRSR